MIISVTIDGYMTLRLFRITFGLIELKGFDEPSPAQLLMNKPMM